MTRRERQSIGRVSDRRRIGYQRGRRILGQEDCWNVVACEYLCRRFARLLRKETAVVPDDHAPLFQRLPCDFVGQSLRKPPHVVQRESFANQRPPSASAERDEVLFLLPPRTRNVRSVC